MPTLTLPLTERVLGRLGRPRWLWIVAWALVALIAAPILSSAAALSGRVLGPDEFVRLLALQAVLAYACFVLLLGTALIARQAGALHEQLARVAPAHAHAELFRGVASIGGPLILTGIVVAVASANAWQRYGPLYAVANVPLLFIYAVPILTFVWAYLAILTALDRLGRQPLVLDLFPEDLTLGLEGLGSLASTGLAILLVAALPVLLTASAAPVTLVISLAIVVAAVAAFVLSMWRLHRQMAAAKVQYLSIARRLYADAYAPIRETANIEALRTQAGTLSAAQSLEQRARNLLTWPVDEGTLKFIAIVITGVITGLIVRWLLAALGS